MNGEPREIEKLRGEALRKHIEGLRETYRWSTVFAKKESESPQDQKHASMLDLSPPPTVNLTRRKRNNRRVDVDLSSGIEDIALGYLNFDDIATSGTNDENTAAFVQPKTDSDQNSQNPCGVYNDNIDNDNYQYETCDDTKSISNENNTDATSPVLNSPQQEYNQVDAGLDALLESFENTKRWSLESDQSNPFSPKENTNTDKPLSKGIYIDSSDSDSEVSKDSFIASENSDDVYDVDEIDETGRYGRDDDNEVIILDDSESSDIDDRENDDFRVNGTKDLIKTSTKTDKNQKHGTVVVNKNEAFRKFKCSRVELARQYYTEINSRAFKGRLPSDLNITWAKRLTSSAGYASLQRQGSQKLVRMTLSEILLDDEDKLRQTILHESCHIAAFLLDDVIKPPHGNVFKKWAAYAQKNDPSLPEVTTYHTYDRYQPHQYKCLNCIYTVGRTTKASKLRCNGCGLDLQYCGIVDRNGTPKQERKATDYNKFMKENYASVRQQLSIFGANVSNQTVMQEIARLYKESKTQNGLNLDFDDTMANTIHNSTLPIDL